MEWIAYLLGPQRWILGGDFNTITGLEETKGGNRFLGNEILLFNRTIGLLNLIGIETNNGPFT
jgi:hypothetical protein